MQLFYCKNLADMVLDAEESRHAVRVLRMREGDVIHVTDGQGMMVEGRIVAADEKACAFEIENPADAANNSQFSILNSQFSILNSQLCLAVAPTKNPSRMEWLVEKAVEVGVGRIVLLQGDHSERVFMKLDRLQRVAVSAMKQSLRSVLPEIHPVVSVHEFITGMQMPEGSQLLIAHCEADKPRVPLASAMKAGLPATVMIGPEGDFSEEEIALALDHGYQPVSLGPNRLRTETAALYALAAFNFVNDIQ